MEEQQRQTAFFMKTTPRIFSFHKAKNGSGVPLRQALQFFNGLLTRNELSLTQA
jgi:hypothetical protein